ncbi:acetyl coenzyme A synthetase (ADP forming), alpha domain protein (plasmid) [Paracoccaceae bacterium]|nr:acetyl coenzyme A synthetase (ADP forming), alpha domain protein [Paracoccaceae bacterium]
MSDTARTAGMDALLRPRAIALVGASNRSGAPGRVMVEQVAIDGYAGAVYPVNPRETAILGRQCYPDLASLPGPVDLAVIALGDRRVEAALDEVIARGIPAAAIFAGCDLSDQGDDALLHRLTDKARAAGLQICGPNSMGYLNPGLGLRIVGYAPRVPLKPGHIALITQSGSAFSALGYNHPRLRFSLAVSTGRELTTRSEDYMLWALAQPETRVIGMFQETAREPVKFRAALRLAEDRGIPVVILKVGKTATSAQFAASHSGAIAGNAAAYEAVFRAHGVIEVDTLDEFGACLQLFSHVTPGRLPGGLLAGVHDSGGEREMAVDLAEKVGVGYAVLSRATKDKLAANLDSGLKPDNPLDAWGSGTDFESRIANCMDALIDDPAVGLVGLFQDIRDGSYISGRYVAALAAASERSGKPGLVVSNYAAVRHDDMALSAIEAGLPVVEGTQEGLKAIRALFDARDRRARPVLAVRVTSSDILTRWRARLSEPRDLSEAEALALLKDYGIRTPQTATVAGIDQLRTAATGMGFPLALKTAVPGIHHKSDVGGVHLGLKDMAALEATYADMAARLGPQAVLEQMMPQGIELAFGIVQDDAFGPFVMVAAGGIWIEALDDRVVCLPPFDTIEARAMLDALRIRPLLNGGRGVPPADLDAIAQALAGISRLAADLGDLIGEMDVNPLFANADGLCAVDALLTVRAAHGHIN